MELKFQVEVHGDDTYQNVLMLRIVDSTLNFQKLEKYNFSGDNIVLSTSGLVHDEICTWSMGSEGKT